MRNATHTFIKEIARNPRGVGAVLPSSRELGECMASTVDFANTQVLVELGVGTGALTHAISSRLTPQHRYIGVEANAEYVSFVQGEFPELEFVCGRVEDLDLILKAKGIDRVDAIICGLPWASLPSVVQERAFEHIATFLAPKGTFCTFAYLQGLLLPGAWKLKARLESLFSEVKRTGVVWRNIPPAFVYVCRK